MLRIKAARMTLLAAACILACNGSGNTGDTAGTGDTADSSNADSADTNPPVDSASGNGNPIPDDVLCINEVMSSNSMALILTDGTAPDWIELHNPGSTAINLGGWEITDDPAVPDKTILPSNLSIPAGGFLVLFADGDLTDGPEHVGFSLKAEGGETLVLTDPLGRTATFELPVATTDFAFARSSDCCPGDCWEAVAGGTPDESNE